MVDKIIPLIELEFHTNFDGKKNIIVVDENNIKTAIENAVCEINLFISSDIVLSPKDKEQASQKNINIIEIPEYYFKNELRELGEL